MADILLAALSITYVMGHVKTLAGKLDEQVDLCVEHSRTTREELPLRALTLRLVWIQVISLLWPLYWVCRLLHAPAEGLLLPPGETL